MKMIINLIFSVLLALATALPQFSDDQVTPIITTSTPSAVGTVVTNDDVIQDSSPYNQCPSPSLTWTEAVLSLPKLFEATYPNGLCAFDLTKLTSGDSRWNGHALWCGPVKVSLFTIEGDDGQVKEGVASCDMILKRLRVAVEAMAAVEGQYYMWDIPGSAGELIMGIGPEWEQRIEESVYSRGSTPRI